MADRIILSSDSHVFEPPDLWTTRIDKAFRGREPRLQRIDGQDHIVVENGVTIGGIGLISNAGARFDAPETLLDHGRFEDVHRGGYDPAQHLSDMALDGIAGEVLYPSQGLICFNVADGRLLSAICRAYNDWLAEFCGVDRQRLKGIAMINLDDVADGVAELERAARLGFAGAMITVYPPEERRYDHPMYEPLWAGAAASGLPLSLHTATRRIPTNFDTTRHTVRDASRRSTKAVLPATSLCDMIFSGVFERHPGLRIAVVEFELAWVPHLLATMDYVYRERHDEASHRFKNQLVPSDFFARHVSLSFQEDAIGMRLRDLIGVDRLLWGNDYPHTESTFPRSREVLDRILEGVPADEREQIVWRNTARLYKFEIEQIARPRGRPTVVTAAG